MSGSVFIKLKYGIKIENKNRWVMCCFISCICIYLCSVLIKKLTAIGYTDEGRGRDKVLEVVVEPCYPRTSNESCW